MGIGATAHQCAVTTDVIAKSRRDSFFDCRLINKMPPGRRCAEQSKGLAVMRIKKRTEFTSTTFRRQRGLSDNL